jgi:hypothetical protein
LGTANFGGRVEEQDARLLIDAAVAREINLIDTANVYGWRVQGGDALPGGSELRSPPGFGGPAVLGHVPRRPETLRHHLSMVLPFS